ncbi:MAG: FmdB family zinc ribbon protein, partial [Candidatus Saccharimonadales bacterium]
PHCGFTCTVRMSMAIVSNAKEFCEECGRQMVRVFSPIGAVFKGTGFYRTDNRVQRSEPKKEKNDDSTSV